MRVSNRSTIKVSRAAFVASLAIIGLGLLTPLSQAASTSQTKAKPNIIVIMTDDQRADDMWPLPKTRALIGDTGVTFDASYVNYPLCCPSRATFLTGQYSHNHGVRFNFAPMGGYTVFKNQENTLPVWLKDAGYTTHLLGKYLNEYGEKNPTEIPPGWTDWFGGIDPSTYGYFGYKINDNGHIRTYGHAAKDYQTDVLATRAVKVIDDAKDSKKPFFMWVTPLAPHTVAVAERGRAEGTPAVPAPRDAKIYANAPIRRLPSFDEAQYSDKPAILQYAFADRLTAPIIDSLTAHYRGRMGSLVAVDDAVAKIVGALKRTGQLENTVLIFTSDNGWIIGEHRLFQHPTPTNWTGVKFFGFEESTKVPLLISGPGFGKARHISSPVSNADLAPTITAIAGAKSRRVSDGVSLLRVQANQARWADRNLLIETKRYPQYQAVFDYNLVHTKRYHLEVGVAEPIVGGTQFPFSELYDLKLDPYELRNVSGKPAYKAIEDELNRRMKKLETCRGLSCRSPGARLPEPLAK
ncbi:MAG: sulfatase [Actinomycetota bacterium]